MMPTPNQPSPQITGRGFANDLMAGLFWLVAVVSLINFHHVANMMLPSGWFVTAGLVAACLALVVIAPFKLQPILGHAGYLMIAAIGTYAVIATVVATLGDVYWHHKDPYLALRPWFAIAVTAGSAAGGAVVLRRVGVERVLISVLVLLGLAAALIFASPWLVEHVYVNLSESEYGFFAHRRGRYFGTFVNPIPAGMAACSAVVLGLATLRHVAHVEARMLGVIIVIAATVAVALTLSRTAVIVLALILVLFLFSGTKKRLSGTKRRLQHRWLSGRGFVALFIGLIVLAVIYRETFQVSFNVVDRFVGIVDNVDRGGVSQRLELLAYGFGFIVESPLIGNGLSVLGWMDGAVTCQGAAVECGIHNSFLQYWGEAGIAPAVLLTIAFVAFLRRSRRLPRSLATDTAFGWTLVFALACLVADGAPHFLWHSFMFGLSCALLSHAAATTSTAPPGEGGTQRDGRSTHLP